MSHKFRRAALIMGLAALSVLNVNLNAQSSASAQLSGQVLDGSGAAVENASVQITETDRNISHQAVSDKEGRYTLPDLEVGPYRLEVSLEGFKTFVQNSIVLHVGDNRQVNVQLAVGERSEQVEVVGGANLVQTEQTAVSQIISRKSILELPLNGRQPTQLVLISGASVVAPNNDITSSKNYPSSTSISMAGGQANGTNYMLDGGTNVDTFTNVNLPFPFPDALQEFGVDTNALPARNGYQPGGLVTIVTKSGGNSYHGDLFEFVRNGDLNARNTFSAKQDTLKRNQFGGTFGGKIIKDKLFFFGGYQGTRIVSVPGSAVAYVPTALELAGNFSVQESAACQSSHRAHAPLKGYPSNQIPVANFDPAALNIAQFIPASADPCGRITYAVRSVQNENQEIGRIDWIQSDKHNAFGRYFTTKYDNVPPYSPTNILVAQSPGYSQNVDAFTYGDAYTFTPNVLNSFHATFTRRSEVRGESTKLINPKSVGINVFIFTPNDLHVTVANDFALGCSTCSTATYGINTIEVADDIDYIRGRHHFGFGGSFIRTQTNVNGGFYSNGQYAFNGTVTGDAMADFFTGSMSSFAQSRSVLEALRDPIFAPYIQDTIRLRPNLVLSAGLRYEPHIFAHDYFHRGSSFSLADFNAGTHSTVLPGAPAGQLFFGDAGIPSAFTQSNWKNISPRLGLVWDISGKGRETLRVGGGILYDSPEVFANSHILNNPPNTNEIDLTTSNPKGLSDPWTTGYNYPGGNPFPITHSYFPQFGAFVVSPQRILNTKVSQWNVTYQRQVGENWVFSGSYIGNRTNHIEEGLESNPAIYSPAICAEFKTGCTTANTNQRRVLNQLNPANGQYYGSVLVLGSGANSRYNGMLVSANHRLTHGASFLANYTWSHCISDLDFGGDIGSSSYMNPANRSRDVASCAFDVRHILNASLIDTVGFKGHTFLGRLVGQWQLAPLVRANSGIPLNVVSGIDYSRTGVGLDRPNYNHGVNPYISSSDPLAYLNPAAFTANPVGTYGNLGRNVLRGPYSLNIDMAATRLFAFRERYSLELRGEAFNIINKVNYLAPSSATGIPGISSAGVSLSLNSPTFGRITSAGDPRILQVAMKLSF